MRDADILCFGAFVKAGNRPLPLAVNLARGPFFPQLRS